MKKFILFFSLIMAFACTVQADHNIQDMKIFAYNPSVGTTAVDINQQGAVLVFPTVAQKYSVASSDAEDDVNGKGARKVLIEGLDDSFKPIKESVSLSGTNSVVTKKSFRFIQHVIVHAFGANNKNYGNITIQGDTEQDVVLQISESQNRTYQAAYMQPAKSLRTLSAFEVSAKYEDITITVKKRHESGIWTTEFIANVLANKIYASNGNNLPDLKIGDILSVSAVADNKSAFVTCTFVV
jgi:hypothetical protein